MSRLRTGVALATFVLGGLAAAVADAQVATVDQLKYPALPAFSLPRPTRTVLPNGLVVLVMEDHELPLVSVSARFRTGSLLEPADKIGVASLTGSQMRSGGTVALAPEALDRYLEGRAASIESSIGDDSGSASMSVLKQDFGEVLQVFSDVLRQPRFDPARLEVARRGIEAGIARQNDDPNSIASREFRELIYGGDTPFARQVTYATVQGLTRDDLVAWHAKYLHPDQTILAVHGDITSAEAVAAVTKVFGSWARGPKQMITFPEPRPQSAPGVFEAVKSDVAQSSIRIGHMGTLKSTHPDYYPVQVLNEVLSGSFTSRLFSSVRTAKGLAYSVGGGVGSNYTRVAPFSMSTSTKTSTTAETIETLVTEAKRIIAEPPTAMEIDLAKQSILNSFIFNSATTEQVLGQQVTYEYYGMPTDWLERYRAGIEKVTPADTARVARQYIKPDQFAILVVGPTEGRDKALSTFGTVKTLDISIPEPPSAAPAAAPSAAPGAEDTGRALISKAVDAMGGAAVIDGVKAYREETTVSATTPQGDIELQSTVLVAPPDRVRQELVTPMGAMTMTIAGATGTVQGGPQGSMPLPEAQRTQMLKQIQRSPIFLLQRRAQAGFKAVAAGDGKVGETPVALVRVDVEGDSMTLGIDPATGQLRSLLARGTGPTGAPADVLTEYGDYRAAGGITVPHARRSSIGGTTSQTVTVKSVQVNPPLPADAFGAAK
ncbi:Peptidase M16 inactive domain protein [Luteitalea pratensis]|uniref:Peptidase M16 inactive domain protein n=1 Tax=Luteitalea pratensis TaxID=1855912 RepID=A0A143PTH6_LUTPR|nr:pitrilysin family protein [Luteitalea pratensis]AMY11636.1 Peptidase M16 inactive domain protein [Luteitalea pratensis]